jgi:glycosyltransferase involved in cell wall biosynthesis
VVNVIGPTPRVSVVIPCHNAALYLDETLRSLREQTLEGFELIVVDDGSDDGSPNLVREWAEANPDVRTAVLEVEHSGHPAIPRNVGIGAARSDLILCLDADDQLTPRFLELCVAALRADPTVSIAYTDQQDFDGADRHHVVPEYDFRTLINRNFFGICSVFRKQAWIDVGGFDRSPYEDWNFWIACGVSGHFGTKVHGVQWCYRVRGAGRFSGDVMNDRVTKAGFVQRRPGLYSATQQAWAQAVLTGDPLAEGIPDTVGTIPEFRPEPAAGPINSAAVASSATVDIEVSAASHPTVTVVIPAYNLAHYLPAAIDSALGQRQLQGSVEVLVVDDGSEDETPQVLAGYGDRIRSVRQPNRGLSSAIDHGLRLANGEFIALLDADDTWPEDRLVRHISALRAHPSAGLVHGDMVITNADGEIVQQSFFSQPYMAPHDGRVLGRLVADNFVSGGASTFRASLLPALHPIPDDVAYPDWWLAACIAAVAEIRTVDGIANNYRQHGANMGLGVSESEKPRLLRAELPWRRKLLREFSADVTVTAAELAHARSTLQNAIQVAASGDPLGARGVLTVDPDASAQIVATAPRAAIGAVRSKALVRALAEDPFDARLWAELDRTMQLEHRIGPFPPPPPLIDLLAAGPLTIAHLAEVVRLPRLLSEFAAGANDVAETTLAVLVNPAADISALIATVESHPAIAETPIQVVSEPSTPPAKALLTSMASFRLTLDEVTEPYAALPQHPAVERVNGRALLGGLAASVR